MDRKYKKADLVHVHETNKFGPVVAKFTQRPYALHGYDNYIYNGRTYKGFVDLDTQRVYILLNQPLL